MHAYPSIETKESSLNSPLTDPHIQIKDLNVYIDGRHILKNINLALPNNSVTSIIGPSGCGKTTLLKTLNRLVDDTKGVEITGSVLVNGEDIYGKDAEVTHIRKKMGLLSQKPYPLPMSIYDNVAYGPRIHGTKNKKELDKIVETQLRNVALWDEVKDRLGQSASGLSIGQQQRLCLARALLLNLKLYLAMNRLPHWTHYPQQKLKNY
ncbi:ATP-binding cassette domain-containing protein [Sphingobacterium sp. E70]|nr:ATP-binding cassette domain-containing protein [Sphingobacterium sp. E70]ULT25298.1 ATP-binding cassette domain-containing protein [Sphingobacterium sp. E70]